MSRKRKNKQIALRFLKELGFFNSWKKYIEGGHYLTKNASNWHKVKYIDEIFGQSDFTAYLENRGYIIPTRIVRIFRSYLQKFYPEKETAFFTYSNEIKIDKNTHTIEKKW